MNDLGDSRLQGLAHRILQGPEPVAADLAAALAGHLEMAALLRGDVAEYDTAMDVTRLARELGRAANVASLLGNHAQALTLHEEAVRLFAEQGRETAALLARLRQLVAVARAGDLATVHAALDTLVVTLTPQQQAIYALEIAQLRAGCALLAADVSACRVHLEDALAVLCARPQTPAVQERVAWLKACVVELDA